MLGKITVIRDRIAFDQSRAKKQQALDNKIKIALLHLPRIVATMHDGMLVAHNRDDLRDILIRDGVLGSRWNARHIANAKKHNLPLNKWEQLTAKTIVDQALQKAEADKVITLSSDESAIKVSLKVGGNPLLTEFEEDLALDPDDLYPLSSNLPAHRVTDWGLRYAHE